MSLATVLLIQAVLFLAYGVGFVISPQAVLSLYGKTLEPLGVVMCRYLGATLIGMGLTCLLARGAAAGDLLNSVILAFFIADAIAFLVSLTGQFGALDSPLHWVNVTLWLLLTLGLGYFRFLWL